MVLSADSPRAGPESKEAAVLKYSQIVEAPNKYVLGSVSFNVLPARYPGNIMIHDADLPLVS